MPSCWNKGGLSPPCDTVLQQRDNSYEPHFTPDKDWSWLAEELKRHLDEDNAINVMLESDEAQGQT